MSWDITLFFWLILIASAVALLSQRVKAPYALALFITGLLIGMPRLLPQAHLHPHTLFTVFLPPLLFESAIHLRLEPLRRDWRAVAIYALFGTILSALIVGALIAQALHVPLAIGLVFGALISATDPISVIAVFKQLGVGKRLMFLMEAESLFNDGIAVVLFTIALELVRGGDVTFAAGVLRFLTIGVGGAVIGAAVGLLATVVIQRSEDHLLEFTLTIVAAYGAYLVAEVLHLSGVIAVVAAGMVIGNYGIPRAMSASSRIAVIAFWEFTAFIVNSIVFLLVGIEITTINLWAMAWLGGGALSEPYWSDAPPSTRSRFWSIAYSRNEFRSPGSTFCSGEGCEARSDWRWRWVLPPTFRTVRPCWQGRSLSFYSL